MTNIDILAVDFNNNAFDEALHNLPKDGLNVLFTNCISELNIGENHYILNKYDSCIYNENKNILILIKREENNSYNDIKDYLGKKDVPFHEVRFTIFDDYSEGDYDVPKLWFANSNASLIRAIENIKQQENDNCVYYPFVESKLTISFQGGKQNIPFEEFTFEGLVQFENQCIFTTSNQKTLKKYDVISELIIENITTHVVQEKCMAEIKIDKGGKVLCRKI